MLTDSEKAYCQALLSLKQKDYQGASDSFARAAGGFGTNEEFNLLYQTTSLLLEVKKELAVVGKNAGVDDKELITDG